MAINNPFKGDKKPTLTAEQALGVVIGKEAQELMERMAPGEALVRPLEFKLDDSFVEQEEARTLLLQEYEYAVDQIENIASPRKQILIAQAVLRAMKTMGRDTNGFEQYVSQLISSTPSNSDYWIRWISLFNDDPEKQGALLQQWHQRVILADRHSPEMLVPIKEMMRQKVQGVEGVLEAYTGKYLRTMSQSQINYELAPLYRDLGMDFFTIATNHERTKPEDVTSEHYIPWLEEKTQILAMAGKFKRCRKFISEIDGKEKESGHADFDNKGVGQRAHAFLCREVAIQAVASGDEKAKKAAADELQEHREKYPTFSEDQFMGASYLMDAYAYLEDHERLKEVSSEVKIELDESGVGYDFVIFNYIRRGEYASAVRLAKEAKQRGVPGNQLNIYALMDLRAYDDVQELVSIFDIIESRRVKREMRHAKIRDGSYKVEDDFFRIPVEGFPIGVDNLKEMADKIFVDALFGQLDEELVNRFWGEYGKKGESEQPKEAAVLVMTVEGHESGTQTELKDARRFADKDYMEVYLGASLKLAANKVERNENKHHAA